VSRPNLGPTQYPIQWVPEVTSPGVKRDADHSPPSSVDTKNAKRHHGVQCSGFSVFNPRRRQRVVHLAPVYRPAESRPASYPMDTEGKQRQRRDADLSPHLVPTSRMSRATPLTPLQPAWRSGTSLLYFYFH
jgi:hypothetical protein